MIEREVTMTMLRQNLAHLINQAAYGRERIVLVFHGQPKAAIVSLEELTALQRASHEQTSPPVIEDDFLIKAGALREQISEWRNTYQISQSDSTVMLREMREQWDDETDSLR